MSLTFSISLHRSIDRPEPCLVSIKELIQLCITKYRIDKILAITSDRCGSTFIAQWVEDPLSLFCLEQPLIIFTPCGIMYDLIVKFNSIRGVCFQPNNDLSVEVLKPQFHFEGNNSIFLFINSLITTSSP